MYQQFIVLLGNKMTRVLMQGSWKLYQLREITSREQ